jgi:predicted AAA+ superfamily ATPase
MIKRNLFEDLKQHCAQKEISLLVGPRQAGKTTLMLMLRDYLVAQGSNTLFLSLDFDSDLPFFTSQRHLVNKIQLEIGKSKGYVFIDEIQRRDDAGLFLKGLYDLNLPYKFIVSGSGSIELKEKIHESLTGRKRIFELNTVSFTEFVNYKTDYRYKDSLDSFFALEKDRTRQLLIEYLNFGGYPRLLLEEEQKEKIRIIDEIYRSYLERDISYLLKVEKTDAFSDLIKVIASQIGRLINYSELSSTLGIALQTIKKYLWYAEKTFIMQRISPFFRNTRKEITKSPVAYFYDVGLRNYALGLYGSLITSPETGFVFQNFVFNLLKEKSLFSPAEIHFWRTKDKAEVDFVITLGQQALPVEIKFKELKKPEISRSLRSFIARYQPEVAWVINLELKEKVNLDNTEIHFLPFWDLFATEMVKENLHLNTKFYELLSE